MGEFALKMMELRKSPSQLKKDSRKSKDTGDSDSEGPKWTQDEDSLLRKGICKFGGRKWKLISEHIGSQSPAECSKRWNKLQNIDSVTKRPWSEEEDLRVLELVEKYGANKWAVIASYLKNRNGKQCRERWHNQLNPSIKKTSWTKEEDAIIIAMQAHFGNKWAKITSQLPGRTDNAVKNHWNSSLKLATKRVRRDGSSGDGGSEDEGHPVKRGKSKKSRKVKASRSKMKRKGRSASSCVTFQTCADDEDVMVSAPGHAFEDIVPVATSACVDEDTDIIAAYISPIEIPLAESAATPSNCIVPLGAIEEDGRFSSPDSVSCVNNLDLYTYAQSYQDSLFRAQAVLDSILDPMGMGSTRPVDTALMPFNHAIQSQQRMESRDDMYCPTTNELPSLVDPTSPAKSPFGLDELLYDSLHDVYDSGALQVTTTSFEASGLVLSAPLGEVARVYQRSTLITEWGTCVAYSSPSTDPIFVPVASPNLSPTNQVDDLLQPKEEFTFGTMRREIQSQEFEFAQTAQNCSGWPSLVDLALCGVMTASGDAPSSGTSRSEVHSSLDKAGEPSVSVIDHGTGHAGHDEYDEELENDEDDQKEKICIRPEPLTQQHAGPLDVEAGLQLIELCREGNLSAVTQRVRSGAPAGFITKSGWTSVAAAAYSGSNDVLLYLLEIGADGMYEASAPSRKYQLSNGNGNFTKEANGNTPLHWACYKGHADTVAILLATGYSPEAADTTGNRCLHLACSGGHREVVEQLLAHSAAVEPRNKYGNRPLDLATEPGCRRLLTRFQTQTTCEWCKETFSRLRRPSLCQHCNNVFCDTKPCSSTSTASLRPQSPTAEANGSNNELNDSSTMVAQARSMRYCQECATEMGKAEQDLRNVLESKLELIHRTLAVLDPSIGNRPSTTSINALNEDGVGIEGSGDIEGETSSQTHLNEGEAAPTEAVEAEIADQGESQQNGENSALTTQNGVQPSLSNDASTPFINVDEFDDQRSSRSAQTTRRRPLPNTEIILSALTLTQTDAEALYTALEAAQLKAADVELLRTSRQTYRQLVAHVALQEEVKALLAVRPIGIRSLLEPLKRALQHATRELVHPIMLSVALQIIQSAEAECTLFGCHALCEKIERGSRRHAKDIARLEASLVEAQLRRVSDKLLTAAGALRDRLNAEVRLEACLVPFKAPTPAEGGPITQQVSGSGGYVFHDGKAFDTLLQALEYRSQLVSTAVDVGTTVEGVSSVLLDEATTLLKQVKKEVRDETKAEEERRKAEEEAALKAAKKSKKKKA
ncbi:Myb-related protein A [Phytophthora citrophthora]|uniref:Myb-related protein A n=1 Tax=Phytophthora citrophthora TaxID=4793 RepID=A0AAD9LLZ4_9STRA|nr:Myb-related protein A [Phytophthora citrophthora]